MFYLKQLNKICGFVNLKIIGKFEFLNSLFRQCYLIQTEKMQIPSKKMRKWLEMEAYLYF